MPIETTKLLQSNEGFGTGFTSVPFTTVNELRHTNLDINIFINTIRAEKGVEVFFEDILPITVTVEDITYGGCGVIADPTCLEAWMFKASVSKTRKVDTIDLPCNWKDLGALQAKILAETTFGFQRNEVQQVFQFISSELPVAETTLGTNNVYQLIERLVAETEKQMYEELGDFAPDRKDLIIAVNSEASSALRLAGLSATTLDMAIRKGNENAWGVKGVYIVPNGNGMDDTKIMVYHPKLKFQVTKCEQDPSITRINQTGRVPNSVRIFAQEMFGFQSYEVPKADDITQNVKVNAGVKYVGALEAVAPEGLARTMQAPVANETDTATVIAQVLTQMGVVPIVEADKAEAPKTKPKTAKPLAEDK